MPEPALSIAESSGGYQLRVVQEVLLALLAKEPVARLPVARPARSSRWVRLPDAMNGGQVYVTLGRLEKAGLVTSERVGPGGPAGPQGLRADGGRA